MSFADSILDRAPAGLGAKALKYAGVSLVAVAVTQVVLIVAHAVFGWTFAWSNIAAVSIGCIPSYVLNRYWVWGKRGRNHFWREVFPFWAMALLGLVFSTVLVTLAERWSDAAIMLSAANLTAFGVLWIAKFFVLDSVLFKIAVHETGVVDDDADEPLVA